MYAKTLVTGPHLIPALMATTDEAEDLMPQLLERGCVPFDDSSPSNSDGRLVVGAGRLRLVVDGRALLHDLHPWAPNGWREL